ncbi:MAG: tRNA (adenosine(37)-N6)-threonylcarbamoyltransferase complex transferase subunit TsaD [Acidiferrobacteraceae bacterium]|jgi:N6-L-threonylcarbamoyladenine synthase|nr:tRNA (adenosine(37)-N6)-threonylcarbamoyltransferase complex transferase subunit TsaD [Acidiferrobacteraceae bacterium]|tara:strand:+ start:27862 stop:28872 length:1011 start_codon:yes stop_codon:yes gene_type:complete
MRVLGIETSCDDTGVALYDSDIGLIAHKLASQLDTHAPYGGIVPELAARDHIRLLMPLVKSVLDESGPLLVDGVAYTRGPGLAGALLVGASFGRALAFSWGVPAVGLHHMEGHLLSPMLEENRPTFPFLALLVSGGHSMLVDVEKIGCYRLLGSTRDDSVGEAFDKTAKLLGLGYPGGPAIANVAKQGDPKRFQFPRPMINQPGFDFSFSGLKTHVRNIVQKMDLNEQDIADIAWAFQDAAVDTLVIKCIRAIEATKHNCLVIAGGVGANIELRTRLGELAELNGFRLYYPRSEFCTDNGAMIAYAGWQRLSGGQSDSNSFSVRPRWLITDLKPVE